MANISAEELKAMMDVQAKSTEQMVIIAGRLQTILESQEKIVQMQDTQAKEVLKAVNEFMRSQKTDCLSCHEKLSEKLIGIDQKVGWVQIIFGSIAFVVAISVAVLQFSHWLGGGGPNGSH